MKKVFGIIFVLLLFLAAACCPNQSQAQTVQDEKIVVNASDLTPEQYAKIKADAELQNLEKRIEKYGSWVGVGEEVGNAMKGALNGVVDVADKFGKTDVGKFTMILVAWKVIGKDVVRIALGLLIGVIFTYFMFFGYRKLFTTYKVRTKGAWYQFWVTKEYATVSPDDDWDGYYFVKVIWWIFLLGGYGITYAIMFA